MPDLEATDPGKHQRLRSDRGESLNLEEAGGGSWVPQLLLPSSAAHTRMRQIPGGGASPTSLSVAACSRRRQSWKLQMCHGIIARCVRASARALLGDVSSRLKFIDVSSRLKFIDLPPPPPQIQRQW
jgi:hypothetical protein